LEGPFPGLRGLRPSLFRAQLELLDPVLIGLGSSFGKPGPADTGFMFCRAEGTGPMVKTYIVPAPEKVGDEPKPRAKIIIDEEWCKGCGICIEFCPKAVLVPQGMDGKPTVTDPALCIKCMLCEVRCPDFAIRIRSDDEDEE